MEGSDEDRTAEGPDPLPFVDGPVSPAFRRQVVTLEPGEALAYVEADWRGALVVVERGDLELECRAGGRRRFGSRDVLWLDGLGLARLRNPGHDLTVLVAVRRRDPPPP